MYHTLLFYIASMILRRVEIKVVLRIRSVMNRELECITSMSIRYLPLGCDVTRVVESCII